MNKVTVKDIARESGYSISTVSKTLNGTDRVGAEAMAKIRAIAERMGYRSSLSAQALARGARRIAIVLFDEPAEVREPFEQGFEEAFALYGEFGIEPVYCRYPSASDMSGVPWDGLRETASAAVVIPSPSVSAQTLRAMGERMPLVILQTRHPQEEAVARLCSVTVNARAVGAMAAQFLGLCAPGAECAVITGYSDAWIHRENLVGFREAAPRCGLTLSQVLPTHDHMDEAYSAAERLLTRNPGLRALFVTNYASPAVCRCVRALNRDVRVVGMDLFADSVACLRDGSLTAAIFQNQRQQARAAVDAAVDALRGAATHADVFVKPELVLRTALPCYGWDAD